MKKILILLLLLSQNHSFGQKSLSTNIACSYYGEHLNNSIYTFPCDNEAKSALKRITDASGLPSNFRLVAGNVPNACAVIYYNKAINGFDRYIIYNQTFMEKANRTINDWASLSILAHEVGHHLSGHSLQSTGSRPELELEADKFSGFILKTLGASLEDAQSAINSLVSEEGSLTHPPKSARLAAIANGWYSTSNNKQQKFVARPNALFLGESSQKVYAIKKAEGLKLISEKGYEFIKSEYELSNASGDVTIIWFPNYNSYGYINNYSEIPLNKPYECKFGNAPIKLDGKFISGRALLVTTAAGDYDILFDGESVSQKAKYSHTTESSLSPLERSYFDTDKILTDYYSFNDGLHNYLIGINVESIKKSIKKGITEIHMAKEEIQ